MCTGVSTRIAEEATRRFEAARVNVGRFIGAPDPAREIVFTKNATEALNLVAHAWGRTHLRPGDVVVLTEMEHHANIVPWHMLADERGIDLRWIPIDDDGRLVLDDLDRLVDGAKLVGVTCMSNVLGTLNPVADIAAAAHAAGALVVADGAQSVPHLPTDVADARRRLPRLQRPQDARARPASASCGAGRSCWPSFRRSSVGAR